MKIYYRSKDISDCIILFLCDIINLGFDTGLFCRIIQNEIF